MTPKNRTPNEKWGLALLVVAGTINFADKAIIGLAAVPIIAAFHLNPSQWGLVGSAFFFLFSISSVAMPFWASRVGTKKVLGILALIWASVQFLTIVPFTSFVYLLGTRVVLGASEGPFYGLTVHLATVWTRSKRRSFSFGVLTLGSALGPALLSPLLAILITQIGWRGAFCTLGVLGLFWCGIWWWTSWSLSDTPKQNTLARPWDIATKSNSSRIIFTILAGFGGYWYLALLVAWMPQYFSVSRHLAPDSSLYLLAVSLPWLGGAFMQLMISFISDKIWQSIQNVRLARVFPLALSLILGAVLLGLAVVVSSPLAAILCLSLSPIGASFPLVAVLLTETTTETYRGQIQGTGVGGYSLAAIIAPVVTGVIIQRANTPSTGFTIAFLIGAGIIAITGFLCWLFVQPLPVIVEPHLSLVES